MLITRETDYALRILRGLADGEQYTAGALSQREAVPQQFAYKILKKLGKAGLVQITRGAEGGCRLAVDLRKVTLFDLMEVMDADGLVISCMEPGYECTWREQKSAVCAVHLKLAQVQRRLNDELRSHTLQALLFGADGEA